MLKEHWLIERFNRTLLKYLIIELDDNKIGDGHPSLT